MRHQYVCVVVSDGDINRMINNKVTRDSVFY